MNLPDLFLIEVIGIYHFFDKGGNVATPTLAGGCLRSVAVVLPSLADDEVGVGWVEPSDPEKPPKQIVFQRARPERI